MGRFHRHDDEHGHSHSHVDEHGNVYTHTHTHDVGDHSGYDTGTQRIAILEDIFQENDRRAAANKERFAQHDVVAVNVMSSPGAGKTTLLEKTLEAMPQLQFGVIEGDIETALDAKRLEKLGARVSLLNTGNGFGGECHLDAPMVAAALGNLDLQGLDLVFIENVGNLVCPAEFEVGEHYKAMITSVTEGEDKPLKYPVMFRSVQVVVINKIDLLPYLQFDLEQFKRNIAQVNPDATIIELSCTTGEGLQAWCDWVAEAAQG